MTLASLVARGPTEEERRRKRDLQDVLRSDLTWLVTWHPFTAHLALHLEIVPVCDSRVPTAATDGRHVYFHIGFADTLSAAERRFVLAHEVWHCALDHMHRRGERERRLWGLAADSEVNSLLARDGLLMPHHAVHFPQMDEASAEQVYAWLRDRPDASANACSFDVHDLLNALECEGGDEWVVDPDFQAGPGPDDLLRRDWSNRLVRAQQAAGRQGSLPAAVACRVAGARGVRPVAWQTVLRNHLQRCIGGRWTFARVSKRHIWRNAWMPGRRGDALSLVVGLDTSGSTGDLLGLFTGELESIARECSRVDFTVIECDAKVHRVTRLSKGELGGWANRARKSGLLGGGGTDFNPVFDLAAREPPQALLFLTDGCGAAPEHPPPYPVIWALVGEQAKAPVAWGAVVRLVSAEGEG